MRTVIGILLLVAVFPVHAAMICGADLVTMGATTPPPTTIPGPDSPVNVTATPMGFCTCNTDLDCQGRKCINGFCYLSAIDTGSPICASNLDCNVPFQCCAEDGKSVIQVSWQEPAPPSAPSNLSVENIGCGALHFKWNTVWKYPVTWKLYQDVGLGFQLIDSHDDNDPSSTTVVYRDVNVTDICPVNFVNQQWAISATSLTRNLESTKTIIPVSGCMTCPSAGDCEVNHDCDVTLGDVLSVVDTFLNRKPVIYGCDTDCDGTVGLNDILMDVDIVLGKKPKPTASCM